MTSFELTKPTIDAMDESISNSITRFRHANDVMSTRLLHFLSCDTRTGPVLRDASKRHDRQVLPAAAMFDDQLKHRTRPSAN